MLNIESLTDRTRKIFEHVARCPALRDFTLIGGTALALQLGHRRSEDLDFWLPAESLNKDAINIVIRMAEEAGICVKLITSSDQITSARINHGVNLLNFSRDYAFNDVKVTFFARYDVPYQHFDKFPRVADANVSFNLMGEDGIFAMKSYVIHYRVRSRDLYDLKTLLEKGRSFDELLKTAANIDPICTPENAKSILSGKIPMDADDEGLDIIGKAESIKSLYEFFTGAINDYEQRTSARQL